MNLVFYLIGNQYSWNFLLGFPLIPSLIGGLAFLFFFPESPKALLLGDNNYDEARKGISRLFLILSDYRIN
jgi:hypothetical protein